MSSSLLSGSAVVRILIFKSSHVRIVPTAPYSSGGNECGQYDTVMSTQCTITKLTNRNKKASVLVLQGTLRPGGGLYVLY